MNIERKFIISSRYFGGYETNVSINDCESIQDIIEIVIETLLTVFKKNKLEHLTSMLNKMKPGFHIHDFTIESILLNDGTYYICNDYLIDTNDEVIENNNCLIESKKCMDDDKNEEIEEIEEIEEMLYNHVL